MEWQHEVAALPLLRCPQIPRWGLRVGRKFVFVNRDGNGTAFVGFG